MSLSAFQAPSFCRVLSCLLLFLIVMTCDSFSSPSSSPKVSLLRLLYPFIPRAPCHCDTTLANFKGGKFYLGSGIQRLKSTVSWPVMSQYTVVQVRKRRRPTYLEVARKQRKRVAHYHDNNSKGAPQCVTQLPVSKTCFLMGLSHLDTTQALRSIPDPYSKQ